MSGILVTPQRRTALETAGFHAEIQAGAVNLDGYTHRDDYMAVVGQYIRKNTIFWPLLPKEPADADLVREIIEGADPNTGFFNKTTMNPTANATNSVNLDISDPGQAVKACGGVISMGHYARSLYRQQNRPFTDQTALKTNKLLTGTAKTIERTLFNGNAGTSPLQFNGLQGQMAAGHDFAADITGGDSVIKKLRAIVRLAISDDTVLRSVTHIFTSGLGVELIEDEADNKLSYRNLDEVRPGLRVRELTTQQGEIPVIVSPYLQDDVGGVGVADTVHFWLVDMSTLVWKGVFPEGGQLNNYNPQVFDIMSNAAPYLTEGRVCICYGTLYARNGGQGIWKLSVTVPEGTVGNI